MWRVLPKWLQMTFGDGVPLTLQSNRAFRPSITSRTSNLRVNRGSMDGMTLSLPHDVISSEKKRRNIELFRHCTSYILRFYSGQPPLAVLSLHMYVPLSSSCTELSRSRHFRPSKCILQLSNAGWISFPSASQSTSVSFGPMMWHSNNTVSPALAMMSLTGRMTARPGSTGGAGYK